MKIYKLHIKLIYKRGIERLYTLPDYKRPVRKEIRYRIDRDERVAICDEMPDHSIEPVSIYVGNRRII